MSLSYILKIVLSSAFYLLTMSYSMAGNLYYYMIADTKDKNIGPGAIAGEQKWRDLFAAIENATELKVIPHVTDGDRFSCDPIYDDAQPQYLFDDVVVFVYLGHGGYVKGNEHVFPQLNCDVSGSRSKWLEDIRDFYISRKPKLVIALSDSCDFANVPTETFPAYKKLVAELEQSRVPERLIASAKIDSLKAKNKRALAEAVLAARRRNPQGVAAIAPPTQLTGLRSLFEGYQGWVIGAGAGPDQLSFYPKDGGAYTVALTHEIESQGYSRAALTWKKILGDVTANMHVYGFPTDQVTLVNNTPVYYAQKPFYALSPSVR
jgi:Caspase domain